MNLARAGCLAAAGIRMPIAFSPPNWDKGQFRRDVSASGYAVLRMPAPFACAIVAAKLAAATFFALPLQQKEQTRQLCQEAAAGTAAQGTKGLVGFNRVSMAKEVFRVRRSCGADADGPTLKKRRTISPANHSGQQALWPPESLLPGFRKATEGAWAVLERVVHESAAALLGEEEYQRWLHQYGRMGAEQQWSASPLDLFLYPNDSAAASTTNCVDHKDPGLVSAIPRASTPGLMVRQHGSDFGDGDSEGYAHHSRPAVQRRLCSTG